MTDLASTSRELLFAEHGLELLARGKVRDVHSLPSNPDKLLHVASNRCSIFDFVLKTPFHGKGDILTALTVFWLTQVLHHLCPNHLLDYGSKIDEYIPRPLRQLRDIQSRSLVVQNFSGKMVQVECVAREYLTGSGWKDYQRTGEVCAHKLPDGLHDGSQLPKVIFTPATKEHHGHDENVSYLTVREQYGTWLEELTLRLFSEGAQYALERGIIIADTKFEFSRDGILADEVLTPDSSRFWLVDDWEAAAEECKSPQGFDKQYVRNWGLTVPTPFQKDGQQITGFRKLSPTDPAHVEFVSSVDVPDEIIEKTMQLYRKVFTMLTGHTIEAYKEEVMQVEL